MRDSQTEDDLRIRDFTTVDESTKVFRLEATRQSHLKLLTPIVDELGILRVGG